MLPTAAVTIFALLLSLALGLAGWGTPAAVAHIAFAVGIVPLIFAAMGHFVPVLTRSGNPPWLIRYLPLGAQLAGLSAVAAMAGQLPRWSLHGAASLDFLLAVVLLVWIRRRAHGALGVPHPGWRWYGAALLSLVVGLAMVPGMAALTPHYPIWRVLHLHLNTLGLVGLAAFGTLPVLLPTALAGPDPEAAGWLRRRLWPFGLGVAAVAIGAAFLWPLAVVGAALLFVCALGLGGQWVRRFSLPRLLGDGVGASLTASLGGFLVLLAAGVLHGAGFLPARSSIAGWAAGFLLPLVSGALSQLLPVWRWPGPVRPARGLMRARLAASGQWRGGLFLLAGLAYLVGYPGVGSSLAGSAMALFLFGLIGAMGVKASAR